MSSIIDDSSPSLDKVYSSSKIEEVLASELPSVSDVDNGKVLGVANETWGKLQVAPPSSRPTPFKVTFTQEEPGGEIVANKTYNEIYAARENSNGGIVYAEFIGYNSYNNAIHYDWLPYIGWEHNSYSLCFGFIKGGDTCFWLYQIGIHDEGCWYCECLLSPYNSIIPRNNN